MKKTIFVFLLFALTVMFACYGISDKLTRNEKQIPGNKLADGKQLVEKYECLTCHKFYGPKVGPAYHGIGIKYRKEFAEKAADSIAVYIKKGSQGKYYCSQLDNLVMPAFDLQEEERMSIAKWVVSLRPMKDMNQQKYEEGQ